MQNVQKLLVLSEIWKATILNNSLQFLLCSLNLLKYKKQSKITHQNYWVLAKLGSFEVGIFKRSSKTQTRIREQPKYAGYLARILGILDQ